MTSDALVYLVTITIMLKRTGTKQRSDDRTTNLSRLIIIGNLRIDLFGWLWCVAKMCGSKPVNPKCGLRVECVGNRHDNTTPVKFLVKWADGTESWNSWSNMRRTEVCHKYLEANNMKHLIPREFFDY